MMGASAYATKLQFQYLKNTIRERACDQFYENNVVTVIPKDNIDVNAKSTKVSSYCHGIIFFHYTVSDYPLL